MNSSMEAEVESLKRKLRRWEERFEEDYGRAPQESDVQQFVRIREKYARYNSLLSALETAKTASPAPISSSGAPSTPTQSFSSPSKARRVIQASPVIHGSPLPTKSLHSVNKKVGLCKKRARDFVPASPDKPPSFSSLSLAKRSRSSSTLQQAVERTPTKQESHLTTTTSSRTKASTSNKLMAKGAKGTEKSILTPPPKSLLRQLDNQKRPSRIGFHQRLRALSNTAKGRNRKSAVVAREEEVTAEEDQENKGGWQAALCEVIASPDVKRVPLAESPFKHPNLIDSDGYTEQRDSVGCSQVKEEKSSGEQFSHPKKQLFTTMDLDVTLPDQKDSVKTKKQLFNRAEKNEQKTTEEQKATKPCRQVSANFVRLNLKRNSWVARRKGGSAASKFRKERRECFQSSESQAVEPNAAAVSSTKDQESDTMDVVLNKICNKEKRGDNVLGLQRMDQQQSQVETPLCPGHQLPCTLLTVKKKNKNYGRQFFVCSIGQSNWHPFKRRSGNEGCKFFMWVDDTQAKVQQAVDEEDIDEEKFVKERVGVFEQQAQKWTTQQLRSELRKKGLEVKGKKQDLVERLVTAAEANAQLAQTFEGTFYEEYCNTQDAADRSEMLEQVLEQVFGYDGFRGDQEWAVQRVLEGRNTLLVQATGSGKSLCYQLPALLLPGLTIVVSPLVSLMDDQVKSLPVAIPGACLNGQQSGVEIAKTLKLLRSGRIKILFLSPERLFSSSFQRLLRTPGMLPPVSLLCVDEAHCISSWSHNFRPSYLRLRELLRANASAPSDHDLACLNPRCVLGLTATATRAVIEDVCHVLQMSSETDVKVGQGHRDNLVEQAFFVGEADRFKKLVQLLSEDGPLSKPQSVIVYVRTKSEAESVAERLREVDIAAKAYHGGMSGADRDVIQKAFMNGSFRVVVATIAFGMGIDKGNVRGVVHFGLARSLEDYVQEIGRAGRDGQQAHCVTYFDAVDARRLHSLSFSEGVEKHSLLELIRFFKSRVNQQQIAVVPDKLAFTLDIKPAVLETVLVYLSLPPFGLLKLLPSGFASATVTPIRRSSTALAYDVHYQKILELYSSGEQKVDLVHVAESLGISVATLIRSLNSLVEQGELSIRFSEPALFLRVSPAWNEWDNIGLIADGLMTKMREMEQLQTRKVEQVFGYMVHLCGEKGSPSMYKCVLAGKRNPKELVEEYFASMDGECPALLDVKIPFTEETEEGGALNKMLVSDIKLLIHDREFQAQGKSPSPRAIARILHGIPSPKFPFLEWRRHVLWGKRVEFRFDLLEDLAAQVIAQYRLAATKPLSS